MTHLHSRLHTPSHTPTHRNSGAADDDAKALPRRQRVAIMLETLSEFAEHHLYGDKCVLLPNVAAGAHMDGKSNGMSDGHSQLTLPSSQASSSSSSSSAQKEVDLDRVSMLVDACLNLPQVHPSTPHLPFPFLSYPLLPLSYLSLPYPFLPCPSPPLSYPSRLPSPLPPTITPTPHLYLSSGTYHA